MRPVSQPEPAGKIRLGAGGMKAEPGQSRGVIHNRRVAGRKPVLVLRPSARAVFQMDALYFVHHRP